MLNTRKNVKSIDWVSLTVYFCLVIIGWLMLYASVYDESVDYSFFDIQTTIGKQTLWIIISLAAFIVSYTIDWKILESLAYPLFVICILLLFSVLFLGTEIKGARSWFTFGGASFQPSELGKLGTALAISSYLGSYRTDIRKVRHFLIALAIIGLPMLLILLQPDAGSAIIFSSFFLLFYRRGLTPLLYIIGSMIATIFILSLIFDAQLVTLLAAVISLGIMIYQHGHSWRSAAWFGGITIVGILLYAQNHYGYAIGLVSVAVLVWTVLLFRERMIRVVTLTLPMLIFSAILAFGSSYAFEHMLEPHQQDRINVWLRPDKSDPHGSRYNITQSKLAIGSGGFQGKGFLKGDMTKLNYVPEQTTDFIFSTVGEEQGFIGSMAVILLFALLIIRSIIIGERAKTTFIQNYAYCVAGILFLHVFINIGMAVGLMPVIGIPLPFLSKGGSSLLVFSMMIGILLRMDMARFR